LAIDDRYAQLLLLRSVKQHTFHFYKLRDPWAVSCRLVQSTERRKYRDVRGKGVLAVVCPGCDTALPATGRSGVERVAARTIVLLGPGGPIGAAQGQASGATQPDFQSACIPAGESGEYQP
jgi:hypothetical protein